MCRQEGRDGGCARGVVQGWCAGGGELCKQGGVGSAGQVEGSQGGEWVVTDTGVEGLTYFTPTPLDGQVVQLVHCNQQPEEGFAGSHLVRAGQQGLKVWPQQHAVNPAAHSCECYRQHHVMVSVDVDRMTPSVNITVWELGIFTL